MLSQGLWEEASRLYPYRYLPALATIGYREIFACLNGQYDRNHAIEQIKQNSRNYAKRQITYFKKDPSIHWFAPQEIKKIENYIFTHLGIPNQKC
jgi:tRNA dimethylallyltransferase